MRVLALTLLLTAPLSSAVLVYNVTLTGSQEVPPTGSPATGFATLTLNDVTGSLLVNLTYSGLLAAATNAHIHCCAPPTASAPVVIPFIPAGFLVGSTAGSFNGTFSLTPALVANVESGQAYVNVHSDLFPNGEIRGDILPSTLVPEPSPVVLLSSTLAWLIAMRRRRSQVV